LRSRSTTASRFPYSTLFRSVNETTARLQENARYAMSVLEPDMRMSGYWGLTNVSDGIGGKALPTDAQSALGAPAASKCGVNFPRSEEHTSELQSLRHLVCRL